MTKAEILNIIREKEEKYNLPAGLLAAVVQIESNFNPDALGAAQEIGLGQLLPKGGAISDFEMFHGIGPRDYWNPYMNLEVAAWYLGERIPSLLRKYGKPVIVEYIIWSYNAGIGNLIKGIKPQITQNYISKVEKIMGNAPASTGTSKGAVLAALAVLTAYVNQK